MNIVISRDGYFLLHALSIPFFSLTFVSMHPQEYLFLRTVPRAYISSSPRLATSTSSWLTSTQTYKIINMYKERAGVPAILCMVLGASLGRDSHYPEALREFPLD
jgi:hypothetical protein